MSQERKERAPICFTCGNEVRPSNRWNRLPDGEVCPICRERLLDLILPPLPRQGSDLPYELVDEGFLPEEDPPEEPRRA